MVSKSSNTHSSLETVLKTGSDKIQWNNSCLCLFISMQMLKIPHYKKNPGSVCIWHDVQYCKRVFPIAVKRLRCSNLKKIMGLHYVFIKPYNTITLQLPWPVAANCVYAQIDSQRKENKTVDRSCRKTHRTEGEVTEILIQPRPHYIWYPINGVPF